MFLSHIIIVAQALELSASIKAAKFMTRACHSVHDDHPNFDLNFDNLGEQYNIILLSNPQSYSASIQFSFSKRIFIDINFLYFYYLFQEVNSDNAVKLIKMVFLITWGLLTVRHKW